MAMATHGSGYGYELRLLLLALTTAIPMVVVMASIGVCCFSELCHALLCSCVCWTCS